MVEFALSVDGYPDLFLTAGAPTSGITSSDVSWSTVWTYRTGFLAYPKSPVSARMRVQDGVVDVDQHTFTLHDKLDSSGNNLITYLATRTPSTLSSTVTTTNIIATSTSFTVAASGTLNAGSGGVAWIDNEAIKYDAPAGLVYPISAGGRGYYGSLPRNHVAYGGQYPEVWATMPFFARRRCLLWVIVDGVASVRWRGYITEGVKSGNGKDIAAYTITAQSTWDRVRDLAMGISDASCRVRGIANNVFYANIASAQLTTLSRFYVSSMFTAVPAVVIYGSQYEACDSVGRELNRQLGSITTSATDYVHPKITWGGGKAKFTCDFAGNQITDAIIWICANGETVSQHAVGSSIAHAAVEIELPSVQCRVTIENGFSNSVPVTDVSDLPATWTGVSTFDRSTGSDGSYCAPVMRGQWTDDADIVIIPTTKTNNPPSLDGSYVRIKPHIISGQTTTQAGVVYGNAEYATGGATVLDSPISLTLAYWVMATHWLYALRYPILNDTTYDHQVPSSDPSDFLQTGADYRDWDFSNKEDVFRHTMGAPNARELFLDGKVTIGAFVSDTCVYNGCCPALGSDGRLRIVPIRPPVPTDTIAATITSASYVGIPEWIPMPEMLANSARIEAADTSLIVNDQRSQNRYGKGRELTVKLFGVDYLASLGSVQNIARSVLQRCLDLWSDPCGMARLKLIGSLASSIKLGDYVQLSSDWFLPNGRGARGIVSSTTPANATQGIGLVIERSQPTGTDDPFTVGLLMFGVTGFFGYAPAARVASISGAVVTLSKTYMASATTAKNYAGVDATTGDGGASKFVAGDKVKLVLRNSTTTTIESLTVLSVNTATPSVTMTASVPTGTTNWPSIIAGGAIVDLIYNDYATSGLQSAQKLYAFLGDETTRVIAGTTDIAPRWAP